MKRLILAISLVLIAGCSQEVKSQSTVTIWVDYGNSHVSYGTGEIEDYTYGNNRSTVEITLKDGSHIIATNYVVKTKEGN